MSHTFYLFLHLASAFTFVFCLGYAFATNGYKNTNLPISRKVLMMIYGLALVVGFVAGFGLIARLNIPFPWPVWIWAKMGIWLAIGMGMSFVLRKPNSNLLWLLLISLLIGAAVFFGVFKYT